MKNTIDTRKILDYCDDKQKVDFHSLRLFKFIFDKLPIGLYLSALDGTILEMNPAFARMLGFNDFEDLKNLSDDAGDFYVDRTQRDYILDNIKKDKPITNYEITLQKHNGSFIYANINAHRLQFKDDVIIQGTVIDITDKVQQRKELELEKEKLKAYFNNTNDIILVCDIHGKIIDANDRITEFIGIKKSQIMNKYIYEVTELLEEEDFYNNIVDKLLNGEKLKSIRTLKKPDGTKIYVDESISLIEGFDDKLIMFFIRDVNSEVVHRNKLEFLATHDTITKLYNRKLFEEKLNSTEYNYPVCVIACDLDGLKLLNDALGHDFGDKLIIEFASILAECFNKDFVARIGGDEFSVIVENANRNIIEQKISKVVKQLENSKILPIKCTVSIGYAFRTEEKNLIYTYKEAEDFMYKRKLLASSSNKSIVLDSLMQSLAEKTHETSEHCSRIEYYSVAVGKELGLSLSELEDLKLLSILHDIGKIATPKEILDKPGKLSHGEWEIMKQHSEKGYRIASHIREFNTIARYILHIHERWDGTGYPLGLSKEQIPLLSRIVSVSDAYDAMTNDRPYRKALSKEVAIDELIRNSGSQFDSTVVDTFINFIK